jgi:D-sedoheptulose 7-phosphate isomerase
MRTYITESIAVKEKILADEAFLSELEQVIIMLKEMYMRGGKLLIAGNDAQHFAAEITCQYREIRKGYPAIALHTDTSALTAWGNDKSFDTFFARQIEALGKTGDVLVVISTSGNSKNLMLASQEARARGIRVIGLLGKGGGELSALQLCDHTLVVPSDNTPRIQESHIMLIHIMCEALDMFFVGREKQEIL